MLTGRTRRRCEALIATRTITASSGENSGWALALAGRLRLQLARLAATLPIAPTLFAPTLTAVRAVPVLLAGTPTAPSPCCLPTGFAAIACLGTARLKPLLAAFQQTPTPSDCLRPIPELGILEWDHGRRSLPNGQVSEQSDRSAPRRFVKPLATPV
jgi:hypothetical protein